MKINESLPIKTEGLQHFRLDEDERLLEYKNGPDVMIRPSFEFGFGEVDINKKHKITYEGLKEARELFVELEERYGVENIGFKPVVIDHPKRGVGSLIVSPKFSGEFYDNNEVLMGTKLNAAKDLLGKLSSYFVDKQMNNERYLSDVFDLRQYGYNRESQKYILLDVDPYIEDHNTLPLLNDDPLVLFAKKVLEPEEYPSWLHHIEEVSQEVA